mgnify:CR=1 FL=1
MRDCVAVPITLEFTFQYGEIKSGCSYICAVSRVLFTFQYGEIKRRTPFVAERIARHIYIPVWRD